MEANILEIEKKIKPVVKGNYFMRMEMFMKGNGLMIRLMDMGLISILMELNMKGLI